MFGNNPKRPPTGGDGSLLYVQEIFPTIQGEALNTGIPSVFIRLGGCNLACNFCDTDFENFTELKLENVLNQITELSNNNEGKRTRNLVVITGGEPLRQPIILLCNQLIALGFKVQIETNGTLYQPLPEVVQIICSPKVVKGKYIKPNPELLPRITAFKFLISDNIEGYNQVVELGQSKYNIPVFVQPMDQCDVELNKKNLQLAIDLAMNYGYRLSYQMHKIIGIK